MKKTLIIVLLIFGFGAAAYGTDLSIGGGKSGVKLSDRTENEADFADKQQCFHSPIKYQK